MTHLPGQRALWIVPLSIILAGCGSGSGPTKAVKGLQGGPAAKAPVAANPAGANQAPKENTAPGAARGAQSVAGASASRGKGAGEEGEGSLFAVAASPGDVAPRYAFAQDGKTIDSFAVVKQRSDIDSTRFVADPSAAPPAAAASGSGTGAGPIAPKKVGLSGGTSGGVGKLPKGFVAVAGRGNDPEGWPTRIRCEADAAEMVFVAGGPTQLGSDDGPPGTGPAVTVMLDSFYIDLHEVTAAQYDAFRVVAPKDLRFDKPARVAKDKQEPVLGINWGEANAYAKWSGKSLPTEPQWERAARGPDAFRAPWGNGTHIWHRSRAYNQIDLVQAFPNDVSPYGVFDMAGNAREWCLDWYAPDAAEQLKRGDSTPRNPPGPKHGGTQLLHVVKGNGLNWNAVDRKGVRMTDRSPEIGFRCVLNLKTEEPEKPAATAKPEAKPKAKGKKKDQPGF